MVKKIPFSQALLQGKPFRQRLVRLFSAGLLLLGTQQAQAQTTSALSGAYTINSAQPTAGTNFTSFTDAATRLNTDGVSGPVTITVSGGPYTEQFLLNDIAGTSTTNTVVVNGGGRTLQFASANSAQRAVVQLNGTDYTTINNLNIDATGGTYGYGVLLTNAADNDKITNNVINADITATSSNFAGIVASGSTSSVYTAGNTANYLTVQGNTINGGYFGVTLYGNTTAAPNTTNNVLNNIVRDFYFYGVYVIYQTRGQLTGNDISRPLRTNLSTFYGVYLSTGTSSMSIERNRLHNAFDGNLASTSSIYGIYLSSGTTPTAASPNDVVNNVLYNLNGNGSHYLIYSGGSAFSRIYNNTISSNDQTATTPITYGIYSSGLSADIRNNVVSITRAGTGAKYGLYYVTNAPTSDFNDIYVPSGNVGYYTAAYATLANWQAATAGFDPNSLSADPVFVNAATGNLMPGNVQLNNAGTAIARVTDDINGVARGGAPDPGAYEFTPVATDLASQSLVSPATGTTCYSPTEAVTVQVRNGGTAALNFATSAATVTVVVTPPTGAAQTFTTTISTGTLASGATQSITLPGTLNMTALGTYSFAVTATVAGDQNTSNDVLTPVATRTVVAPVAGTLASSVNIICTSGTAALSLTGSANGSLQYQSGTSATGPFTNVAGATSATYTTPVLTSTAYYRVQTTCNTNVVYSNVVTLTVNAPQVATTNSPQTICAGSTATLTATANMGSTVRFFSAATGGAALTSTTAGSYTTPALTASTTYYAEAYSSGQETVGKPLTNGLDGTNTVGGLYFTATNPTTILTVTVYRTASAAAGTATVYLLPGNPTSITTAVLATALTTSTVTVPANTTAAISPTVLTLNYAVPAAGSYTLYLGAATPSLIRDYSTTATPTTYPYTSPSGNVSITGATLTGGYYYFFYNWQVSSECAGTPRTAIQVNVTPAPATPTLTATTQPNGSVLLTTPAVTGATYQFYNGGVAVGTPSTSNTLLLQSSTLSGSYTVAITSGGCASAQSAAVVVTVVTGTRTATLNGVSLLVYPNPTPDGRLTLELTGPQAKASELTVVNSLGQVVHARTIAPGTATLSLTNLAAGVYNLRVQTPDGVLTQRIVRE